VKFNRGTVASGKRRAGGRAQSGHFLPFFCISTQKIFFFSFIDLYPPLSTFIGMVWRGRTRGGGARPDGSDCAPLWRKTPRAAADGMPSGPVLTFVARNLMVLTGVSHSEGNVKANLEKSAGGGAHSTFLGGFFLVSSPNLMGAGGLRLGLEIENWSSFTWKISRMEAVSTFFAEMVKMRGPPFRPGELPALET
jgi:hypothetical protein